MTDQSNRDEKRKATAAGVRRLRAKQGKKIKKLGYTSEQNMTTRVLNNDLTLQHMEYLKEVMK
jgi:hypothetical protein